MWRIMFLLAATIVLARRIIVRRLVKFQIGVFRYQFRTENVAERGKR